MAERTDIYQNPLIERYSSKEMQYLFSPDVKFTTWRRLWIALAEAEKEIGIDGVNITDEQIEQMRANMSNINYDVAKARERKVRHDVMSHVYAFGVQCPDAAGIIHLGATSCYVTDNTDILIIYEGLQIIKKRLLGVIKLLADFADKYKAMPTLGYTHYQPAAPVTVGKRAALWLQEFVECYYDIEALIPRIKLLGCRGATGTQATFMGLFDGDEEKVKKVERLIADKLGEFNIFPVSAQTYPRSLDQRVISCLALIATAAGRMGNDIRHLQHDKEMEEPFEKNQIGSSAMAYKRNPMRSERIVSLSRNVQSNIFNAINTATEQWLERTLDDSANRRLSLPESFLATDAILILVANVTDGLVVNDKIIEKHLKEEIPFLATEEILMEAVRKGGNRQELHERIRVHSMEAGKQVKVYGLKNDLVQRIAGDPAFGMTVEEIEKVLDPGKLTGRCESQVREYLEDYVYPVLKENEDLIAEIDKEVTV